MKEMVAVCGINCTYCYAHHKKKACPGCRLSGGGKPEHCRKCKIKECAESRHLEYCADCAEYPCVIIKRLDKSYRTRYSESLIQNMKIIQEKGMDYYLKFEEKRFKCPECGGVLNMHDKTCSGCGKVFEIGRLE